MPPTLSARARLLDAGRIDKTDAHDAPRRDTVLCLLTPGGLPRQLSAARAALELRRIRPSDQVGIERRRLAVELLTEVRAADRDEGVRISV